MTSNKSWGVHKFKSSQPPRVELTRRQALMTSRQRPMSTDLRLGPKLSQIIPKIESNSPQMLQIRDFLKSVFITFFFLIARFVPSRRYSDLMCGPVWHPWHQAESLLFNEISPPNILSQYGVTPNHGCLIRPPIGPNLHHIGKDFRFSNTLSSAHNLPKTDLQKSHICPI